MAQSILNLHSGGHLVTYEELQAVKTPEPEGRWVPIGHATVLDTVKSTLLDAGFEVRDQKLALDRNGTRFFGTLDLATPLASGISLCVGTRNSIDRSFSQGFLAGAKVFVCSNTSFRADLMVSKRHTKHGQHRFAEAIVGAVSSLKLFKETEADRINRMIHHELTADQADALMLRAYERGLIGARELPKVIREWREPSFEEFQPRTVFSLLQAFTSALRERATAHPQQYAVQTMKLNALLEFKDAAAPHLAQAS